MEKTFIEGVNDIGVKNPSDENYNEILLFSKVEGIIPFIIKVKW